MGVPTKEEKTEHASTCLVFLGIEFDTVLMEARLPFHKICKISFTLASIKKKRLMLRELQSIIGLLNFACSVVLPGRAFLRGLIDLTKGVSKPDHYIRLTTKSKADLQAWYTSLIFMQMLLFTLVMVLFIRLIGCVAFGVSQ